jgi:hypothetical protein
MKITQYPGGLTMNKVVILGCLLCLAALLTACGSAPKHHRTDMPDPGAYNAHFGDIDDNGNGEINWSEFKRYFPEAEPSVFMELDLNDDSVVDHDEWHRFKEAHGLTHG